LVSRGPNIRKKKEKEKKPEAVEYACAVLFWSIMFYRQSLMCLEKRDELPHLHDNFYFSFYIVH